MARRRPGVPQAAPQADLFGEPMPPQPPGTSLKLQAPNLSPEQQRFNRLLTQVERLTGEIEAWRRLGDELRATEARELRPLELERSRHMRAMALFLDERLNRKGLTPTQVRTAREIIASLAQVVLAIEGDEAMRALHDRHSATSLEDKRREEAGSMHEMLQEIFGDHLDLDTEEPPASLEEVMQAARRAAQAKDDAEAEARAQKAARRKKTAATPRQQQAAEAQQDAQGALRTLYRQLASALHPDREPDPAERQRKTEWMGQANAAYERRDLKALLQLQLQVEHIDADDIARMAQEKARAYTLLLKEQAEALQADLDALRHQLAVDFELPPFLQPTPAELRREMRERKQEMLQEIHMMTRDLQRVRDDAQLKRWLRDQRSAVRRDLPF